MSEPRPIRQADDRAPRRDDQSVGDLVKDLIQDVSDLIRAEIQLARQEISSDVAKLGGGAAFVAVGAAVALIGLIYLIFAAILALGTLIGTPLAAAIVGGVILVVGGILALVGIGKLRSAKPVPEKTISAVKEDAEWLKNRMS